MTLPSPPDDDTLIRPLSDLYPAMLGCIYIDAVSSGLMPVSARDRAVEILNLQLAANVHQGLWPLLEQSCRARFAGLVGTTAHHVTLSSSFLALLERQARAIGGQLRGGNLVLCAALSSPQFAAFWRGFAGRESLELREVPVDDGGFLPERVAALVDAQTLAVALPAVSHARGWRLPLARIGGLCRDRDVFFLVDGTSSAGVLQIDVARDAIDGMVVAAEANALGTGGLGFSYLCRDRRRLPLPSRGSVTPLFGDQGALPINASFHAEKPLLPVLAAAAEALGVFDACGAARIERHALGLASRLRSVLGGLGLPVEQCPSGDQSSHVVAVGLPAMLADGVMQDPQMHVLAEQLAAGRVRYGVRGGQLQFGFHLYNRLRDVMDVRHILAQARQH